MNVMGSPDDAPKVPADSGKATRPETEKRGRRRRGPAPHLGVRRLKPTTSLADALSVNAARPLWKEFVYGWIRGPASLAFGFPLTSEIVASARSSAPQYRNFCDSVLLLKIGRRWDGRKTQSEQAGHHSRRNDPWRLCGDRSYCRLVYVGIVAR